MIELSPSSLNSYITLNRSCRINSYGYVIPFSSGSLNFDFSSINAKSVLLKLKRLPGCDGSININGSNYVLLPNKENEIIINSDKIFINRDNAKNGNVAIIKVIIDNEVSDKKIVMSDDWHVFLKKIKSMKGISVSEMGVFASSGAEMVGTSFIDSIETDPPVSFRIFDDSIKFQNACRIIMIKKKDDIDINGFVFKPLNQIVESINQSSKQSNNVNILLPSEKVNFIRKQNIIRPKMNSIYSDVTNIFNLNNLNVNLFSNNLNATNHSGGVCIESPGYINIPISNIKPYRNYVVTINCARLSGNGKIDVVLLLNGYEESRSSMISPGSKQSITCILSTKNVISSDNAVLRIERPKFSAMGGLVVYDIVFSIKNEIQQQNVSIKKEKKERKNFKTNISSFPEKKSIIGNEERLSFNKNNKYDIVKNIKLNIFKDEFSCLNNYFPNINVVNENEDLLICDINSLNKSKNIYLNYFEGTLSEESLEVLSCSKIYSPSLVNVKYLKSKGLDVKFNPLYFVLDYNFGYEKPIEILNKNNIYTISDVLRSKVFVSDDGGNYLDPYCHLASAFGAKIITNNKYFVPGFVKTKFNKPDSLEISGLLNSFEYFIDDNYNDNFYNFIRNID